MATDGKRSSDELAEIRTGMAARRTLMAADRSLMAWVRTALSMTSFGFTIYKVLEGFQASGAGLPRESTPRNFGLFLIGLGLLSMVMGTTSYLGELRELRRYQPVGIWQPAFIMALMVCFMGLVLFFGVVSRIL